MIDFSVFSSDEIRDLVHRFLNNFGYSVHFIDKFPETGSSIYVLYGGFSSREEILIFHTVESLEEFVSDHIDDGKR